MVLKQRMTAMELLRAAKSLQKLATDLHVHLAGVCGPCGGCNGDCPVEDGDEVDLPDYLGGGWHPGKGKAVRQRG